MSFESYFRACSYAMIASGVLALAVSGGVGVWLAVAFVAVLVISWKLTAPRRQMSERAGMFVVLLALPAFYLDWSFQRGGATDAAGQVYAGVSALVHFTLLLSSIKLLQVKSDRDWLFLYLISFFEVLLAAGLSVSPAFLLSLGLYVFTALLAVVCFELRKSSGIVSGSESRLLVANDPSFLRRRRAPRRVKEARALRRLPLAAAGLFVLIFGLALPIFFITPRAAESALSMPGGAASTGFTGFSDHVTLGDIGRLNESNQLVMRVRVEGPGHARATGLRWRGVALDHFDGRHWSQTSDANPTYPAFDGNLFRLATTEDLGRLTTQTFFVEPIDTPVIFAAPRALALQGAFPYVRRDKDDGLASRSHAFERITYTAYSDTFEPPAERLRADALPGTRQDDAPNLRRPIEDYLQLPAGLDARVGGLARTVVVQAGARNAYDAARAVEAHLNRNAFGGDYRYSLELRATGTDPVADFLFNVRAGHCEYFATAMAVMLRTLRIPARVVNGFQPGEYNSAADAYIVRQADAHSWVEVYFAEADAWVTFDPTPADGRPAGTSGTGLTGSLRRYADAMELFWIQYVVAYDRQGQRALARTLHSRISSYRFAASESAEGFGAMVAAWLGGSKGGAAGLFAAATSPLVLAPAGLLFVGVGLLWLRRKGFRGFRRGEKGSAAAAAAAVIEFYERMTKALAARGLSRRADETPLEFAEAVGTPEVLAITKAYNRVRFGARDLTGAEAAEVERHLNALESDRQLETERQLVRAE
jgi:transglutaminase-like putative cysteine protease